MTYPQDILGHDVRWTCDPDGSVCLYMGDACALVYGVEKEAAYLSGKALYSNVLEEDKHGIELAWAIAKKEGKHVHQFIVVMPNGDNITIEEHLEGRKDAQGNLLAINGSAKRPTALAFDKIRHETSFMLESMGDAFLVADKHGMVVYASTAGQLLLAKIAVPPVGQSLHTLFPEALDVERSLNLVFKHSKSVEFEEFLPSLGIWLFFVVRYYNQYAYIYLRDITVRKHALLNVKASENKLKAILNSTTDSYILVAPDYSILMFNRTTEQAAKLFLGKEMKVGDSMLDYTAADAKETFIANFNKARAGDEVNIERSVTTSHGDRWFAYAFKPVYDNDVLMGVSFNATDIHDRKMAEIALRESEAKFRLMAENTMELVAMHAPDGTYTYLSPSVKTLLGYEPEELIGKSPYSFFHPDDAQRIREDAHQVVLENLTHLPIEYRIRKKNNTYTWFETNTKAILDASGQVTALQTVSRDISERVADQEMMLTNWMSYKHLFDNNPLPMFIVNASSFLFMDVNNTAVKQYGYTKKEFTSMSAMDIRPEHEAQLLTELLKASDIASIEQKSNGWRHIYKDGTEIIVSISAHEIEHHGQPAFLAVARDITVEKQLSDEAKRLALIAKHTSNAVFFTDVQGKVTWTNHGLERLLGKSWKEMVGAHISTLFTFDKNELPKTIQKLQPAHEVWHIISATGKKHWLDTEIMVMLGAQGEAIGFMAIQNNITDLKEAVELRVRSERQMQTIIDHAPWVVFMKDSGLNYLFVNNGYKKAINRTDSIVGLTDYDIFDTEFARQCQERDRHILNTGEILTFEHEVAGQIFYEVKFPIRDHNDHVFAIGGVSINITTNLIAEQKIKQLSLVASKTTNAVVMTDANGLIVWVNEGFTRMSGYPQEDVIGKKPGHILQGELSSQEAIEEIREAIEMQSSFKVAIVNYTKSGKPYWNEITADPIFDEAGRLTGFVAIQNDITERKHYESMLLKQNQRLKEIAWMQSHKIRGPVSTIMGLINVAMLEDLESPILREILEGIESTAQRLDDMIHHIVQLSNNMEKEEFEMLISKAFDEKGQ